jgi:hypothetical protein
LEVTRLLYQSLAQSYAEITLRCEDPWLRSQGKFQEAVNQPWSSQRASSTFLKDYLGGASSFVQNPLAFLLMCK